MTENMAAIGFGANLDQPKERLTEADNILSGIPSLEITNRSSIWLTEPVGGPPDQNWYHNQVVLVKTTLAPRELLSTLLDTETKLGRIRKEHWGPRTIDLDLLFMDGVTVFEDDFTLPHPRLHERAFVLFPLSEVAPNWVHPILNLTITELKDRLPREYEVKKL